MARKVHFRVYGMLDRGRPSAATVTIDREAGTFSVRPLRRRKVYGPVALDKVAAMVVQRLVAAEVLERRRERAARGRGRQRGA